jgi:hypothetical protein
LWALFEAWDLGPQVIVVVTFLDLTALKSTPIIDGNDKWNVTMLLRPLRNLETGSFKRALKLLRE